MSYKGSGDNSVDMELPVSMHASRRSPRYFMTYAKIIPISLLLGGAVGWYLSAIRSVLEGYGMGAYAPAAFLVAVLPLLKLIPTELAIRHHRYRFEEDRVIVETGGMTKEQEDIPFSKIADVSSVTPPLESLLNVGDLELHLTGTDKTVELIGLRRPQLFEDLMMGRDMSKYDIEFGEEGSGEAHEPIPEGPDTSDQDKIDHIREEMQQLEQQYNSGQISQKEYENSYYYLKGELDALQGDV